MPTYEELMDKLIHGTITPDEQKQLTAMMAAGKTGNGPAGSGPTVGPGRTPGKNPYSANSTYRTGSLQQDLPVTPGQEDTSLPVSQLMEAFRKGLYGTGPDAEQKFRKDLTSAGYENQKDQDFLVGLAAKQPNDLSITQLASAKKKGLMDDTAISARLAQSGYGAEDTKVLMGLIDQQVKDSKPDLNVSQMGKAMKDGLIKPEDVAAKLKDAGYSDTDSKVLMGLMNADNRSKLPVSTLGDAYKRGDISKEQLMTKLTKDNDLSPEDAALVFKDIASNTKTGLGTTSDLYQKGQIAGQEAYDKLTKEQGYSDKDARDLLAVWDRDRATQAQADQERAANKAQSAADRQQRLQDRAESNARQAKSDERQQKLEARREFNFREQSQQGTLFDDKVEGYMNDFKNSYVNQIKTAGLGPEASQWLLDNPNLAMKAHTGDAKGAGGILNAASLMNLYEGQRGIARKQGQTNAAEISATQIG